MSDKKQLYIDKMEAQLKEWSAHLDLAHAKADTDKAEAKIETHDKIDSLRAEGAEISAKLAEIKEAGAESWEELTKGADKAWTKIKDAFSVAK